MAFRIIGILVCILFAWQGGPIMAGIFRSGPGTGGIAAIVVGLIAAYFIGKKS